MSHTQSSMSNQDDWETDPDFVNDITEKESRWGSKTVAGSGLQGAVDLESVRKETIESDRERKRLDQHPSTKPSFGYGGKFGIMKDRMDKSAETWSYKGSTEKHPSQVDYAYGFGGKYGVQTDRQDESAHDWDHKDKLAVHDSQRSVTTNVRGKVSHDWLNKTEPPVLCTVRKPPIQLPTAERNGAISDSRKSESTAKPLNNSVSIANDDASKSTAKEALLDELSICKASALREKFEKLSMEQRKESDRPTTAKLSAWKKTAVNNGAQAPLTAAPITIDNTTGDVNDQNDNDQVASHARQQAVGALPVVEVGHAQFDGDTESATAAACSERTPEAGHPLGEPEHPMADTGIKAIALYDYQAGDVDEITFEPDDIISNIDMVDTDWWRGFCRGRYGLFPANYVELCP